LARDSFGVGNGQLAHPALQAAHNVVTKKKAHRLHDGLFIWWCWRVRLVTFYFGCLVSQRKSACLENLRKSINTHQYGVFMLSSR